MTELKRLSPAKKARALDFSDGMYFGMGFWAAGFVFSFIIVPAMICAAFIVLSVLGTSLAELLPSR